MHVYIWKLKKIETFLSDTNQCLNLNGEISSWTDVNAPGPDDVGIIRNDLTQENKVNHHGIYKVNL